MHSGKLYLPNGDAELIALLRFRESADIVWPGQRRLARSTEPTVTFLFPRTRTWPFFMIPSVFIAADSAKGLLAYISWMTCLGLGADGLVGSDIGGRVLPKLISPVGGRLSRLTDLATEVHHVA